MGSVSRLVDDRMAAQKALQTVAAGQQSENLLDLSDNDGTEDGQQPSGLAATTVLAAPAAENILSGTSSNPLDDLVSIFGSVSVNAPTPQPKQNIDPLGGLAFSASPVPASTLAAPQTKSPPMQQSQQDDLLGLF